MLFPSGDGKSESDRVHGRRVATCGALCFHSQTVLLVGVLLGANAEAMAGVADGEICARGQYLHMGPTSRQLTVMSPDSLTTRLLSGDLVKG